MLRKVSDVIGRSLMATDGEVGEVRGCLFDDRDWVVRYLLVDTSPWFNNREVIIATSCFSGIDWRSGGIPVQMTKEDVQTAPGVDRDHSLSHHEEERIIRDLGWPMYWNIRASERRPLAGTEGGLATSAVATAAPEHVLRSTVVVVGYEIAAADGTAGDVADFIIDDTCWQVRYVVIDTGRRLPGKRVLLPVEWVKQVEWGDVDLRVALTKEKIANAPAYDPSEPVGRELVDQVCEYYGLPAEWAEKA